jgi:phospholipase C
MSSSKAELHHPRAVVSAALAGGGGLPPAGAAEKQEQDRGRVTASPIKHVIIIVGENRSFDHLFATFVPKRGRDKVNNLLSQGIVNADGSPGRNFAKGQQFQIVAPPNGGKFFINSDGATKRLYQTLPPPDIAGVGPVSPYAGVLSLPGGDPGLPPEDQFPRHRRHWPRRHARPDTRIANVNNLPPGPFQMTGPDMPFDALPAIPSTSTSRCTSRWIARSTRST